MITLQNSGIPIYLQIYNAIRDDIKAGRLIEGSRLEAERVLASRLGINRSTVVRAYKKLEAEGFLLPKRGSGYTVTHQYSQAMLNIPVQTYRLHLNSPLTYVDHNNGLEFDDGLWQRSVDKRGVPKGYYFVGTMTPEELCPVQLINETILSLIQQKGAELYDYCSSQGLRYLRTEISKYLQKKRIYATPGQIVIANEVVQLIDFLLHIYIKPGDIIITEEPIFTHVYQLFQLHHAKVVLIPMDEEGLRTDLLERELEQAKPKLLCVTPSSHNPTNITMSQRRRLQLMSLARRYGIPVIEWSFCGDLEAYSTGLPALKAIDSDGFVIYINSFNPSFAQSIPISYAVANTRTISAIEKMIQMTVFQMDTLSQYILAECLNNGSYERHLSQIRSVYAEKANTLYRSLERLKKLGVFFTVRAGGSTVWCKLPDFVNSKKLYQRAREEHLYYHPGGLFYPNSRQGKRYIRLSYLYPSLSEIEEGIAKLADIIQEQCPLSEQNTRAQRERKGKSSSS